MKFAEKSGKKKAEKLVKWQQQLKKTCPQGLKVLDNFTMTLFDKFFYNIICNRQPFWNLRKNPAKKKRKNLSNNSSNLKINLPRESWKGRARFLRISHWNHKITVKDQKKSSKFSAFWGTYLDFDSSFISNGPQPGLAFWVSSTKVRESTLLFTDWHWPIQPIFS